VGCWLLVVPMVVVGVVIMLVCPWGVASLVVGLVMPSQHCGSGVSCFEKWGRWLVVRWWGWGCFVCLQGGGHALCVVMIAEPKI
jgi:hypothetical protein